MNSSVKAFNTFKDIMQFFDDVEKKLGKLAVLLSDCDEQYSKAIIGEINANTINKVKDAIFVEFIIKDKNYPYDEIKTFNVPLSYYWLSVEEIKAMEDDIITKTELSKTEKMKKQKQFQEYKRLKVIFESDGNDEH